MGKHLLKSIEHVAERAIKAPIQETKLVGNAIIHPGSDSLRQLAGSFTDLDKLKVIPSGVENVLDKAAPIALNFIPGVGQLASAGFSAAQNYAHGGSLGGSLLSGAGSLASSYGGNYLGGQLAGTLGTSAGQASGLAGAAIGAGVNKLQGQNPLLGAISGGIGAYAKSTAPGGSATLAANPNAITSQPLSAVGVGNVADAGSGASGSSYGGSNTGSFVSSLKNGALGRTFGLDDASQAVNPANVQASLNNDANIPASLKTNTAQALTNGATDVAAKPSGGLSDLFSTKNISPLLSAGLGAYTNSANKADLLKANAANSALLTPFTTASFQPGDLTQDPGYQFQLQQGTDALNRKQAASGNYFSGAALQAAQDYGQGLAGTTYNDAYGRFLQQNQQHLAAAGALASNNSDAGNINAAARTGTSNVLAQAGAGILGGTAFGANGQSLSGGNLLGGLSNLTPDQLALYLKQQQGVSSYGRT